MAPQDSESKGSKGSSRLFHFFKNLSLLLLSLALFPTTAVVAFTAYLWHRLTPGASDKLHHAEKRVTVLVTGVNMSKGLSLARLFYRRGHRVIGADSYALSPGRVSCAVDKYYCLPKPSDSSNVGLNDPYLNLLMQITQKEEVDLWISVSDVNAAIQDAAAKEILETRTKVKAIQFGVEQVRRLHEKDCFIEYTKTLGLTVPTTEIVSEREEVIHFLGRHGGLEYHSGAKRYLVKPVGVDDVARFSMPMLPLPSEESTLARIDSIPFKSAKCSFIIQEFISGPEFCTHALVIHGRVCAFVACRSANVLMHYDALPADSLLSKAMLDFTIKQAEAGGDDFTGHLSFDFLTERHDEEATQSEAEKEVTIYPIECNPRVHTATLLFNETPEIVDEYLSVLSESRTQRPLSTPPLSPANPRRYYWASQDLVELVIYPLYLTLFCGTRALSEFHRSIQEFSRHLLYWKDGTFEAWDPWPWLWMMHVYWPMQFAWYMATGVVWTKLNVSTGKAFQG